MIATRGLGSQQLITQGFGDFGTHKDLAVAQALTYPFTEGKPPDGFLLEPLPTRPAAADGFFLDSASDGFSDEYPVDGFYSQAGYMAEFKPFHRATVNKEGKPN